MSSVLTIVALTDGTNIGQNTFRDLNVIASTNWTILCTEKRMIQMAPLMTASHVAGKNGSLTDKSFLVQ